MPQTKKHIMFRGPLGLLCRPHINSELEIIVATRGEINVTIGDTTFMIQKREAAFILPYETHAFTPIDNSEGRVYMFSFGLVEDFYNRHGGNSVKSGKFALSSELFSFLSYATPNAESIPDEFNAKSLFFPLVCEYLRSSSPTPLHNNKHAFSVRRIVDHIHENITEKITLSSISQALGISPTAISDILREYTGITFTDFVNNLRLEKAVHLLHDCDISITEAAYQSGFGSVRNFNRIFFDTLGMTPSEYKKTK